MKRKENYLKNIHIDSRFYKFNVAIDISDDPKLKCFYVGGANKLNNEGFFSLNLPETMLLGKGFNGKEDKKIKVHKSLRNLDQMSPKQAKKETRFDGKELNITPNQLIEQLNGLLLSDQKSFEDCYELKRQNSALDYARIQWIKDVNANWLTRDDIKFSTTLTSWNKWKKGNKTLSQSLPIKKIIIFNRLNYLDYDEFAFKQIYIHELSHIFNYENSIKTTSNKTILETSCCSTQQGHDINWLNINYEINKKVFNNDVADFVKVKNLIKYSSEEVKFRGKNPPLDDYLFLKQQESLAHAAKEIGLKLNSNNILIQKFNNTYQGLDAWEWYENNKYKFQGIQDWQDIENQHMIENKQNLNISTSREL